MLYFENFLLSSDGNCVTTFCFLVDAYITVQTLTLFWRFLRLINFYHIFLHYYVTNKLLNYFVRYFNNTKETVSEVFIS